MLLHGDNTDMRVRGPQRGLATGAGIYCKFLVELMFPLGSDFGRTRYRGQARSCSEVMLAEAAIPTSARASGIARTKPRRNCCEQPQSPIPPGDRARDGCFKKITPEVRTLPDVQDGRTDAIVGLRQPKRPRTLSSPLTMAAARWPRLWRALVCGTFVRRHANGGDPDAEGHIRLLIEPEGESSEVTCNGWAGAQCGPHLLPRRCSDPLWPASANSRRYSRQDPGERIDFHRLSKGIATILIG